MRQLFEIIKKNLKLLLRSKTSALIVILGPLLVIFLMGIAFDNSNLYALNIGVIAPEKTELTAQFITKLQDKQFSVKYIDNEELCVQEIQEGVLHACILFPPGLNIEKKQVNKEITFYVDYSKINMIYVVIETLTNKMSLQSEEISMNLTNILTQLGTVNTDYKAEGTEKLKTVLMGGTNVDSIKAGLDRIRISVSDAKAKAEELKVSEVSSMLGTVNMQIGELKSNITTFD